MNAPITLALLRRSEKGFALPLALLIGLILIGTGITMISRSQGDQSKVVAQRSRAEGLTGTEAGLARVQDYLNTVRPMATRNSSCASGDNCWASATFPTGNPTTPLQKQLVTLQAATTCSAPSTDTTASTRISSKIDEMQRILANGGQESLVANASQNRFLEYRIVSYNFTTSPANDVEFIGQGILTLEGRSGKTVLANNVVDNAESKNRLVVSIPVYPSYPVAFNRTTAPAVWISEGGIEDASATAGITASAPSYSNGSQFQGDVVMSDALAFDEASATLRPNLECFLNTGRSPSGNGNPKIVQPTSPSVTPAYRAQFFTSLSLPATPSIPTDIPSGQQNIEINSATTFPRPGDTATTRNSISVYEYQISSINLNGETVTITPGQKVIFYVDGNINTNGNGGLKHVCGSTPNCNASNFLIIAYNTSNATDAQICLKDQENLEAFILAPQYALGLRKTANTSFTGSMWGKSWGKISGCSENNQTAITQGAIWDDLVYNFKPNRLRELPQIGQVLTWCEEAIDTTNTQCTPSMPVFRQDTPPATPPDPTLTTSSPSPLPR